MPTDIWTIMTAVPLLICSVVAMTLIVERLVTVSQHKGLEEHNKQTILNALNQHRMDDTLTLLKNNPTGYQSVIDELVEHRTSSKPVRDEATQIMLVRYTNQLRQRLSGLTTVASLAPMLGLLGTIIGLMRSFRDIGISQGPVEPSVVADGLWQALTTTAAGMLIAVLCVLFHAVINSRIRRHLADARDVLNLFSHCIHLKESE